MTIQARTGDFITEWVQCPPLPGRDGQIRHLIFARIVEFEGRTAICEDEAGLACGDPLRYRLRFQLDRAEVRALPGDRGRRQRPCRERTRARSRMIVKRAIRFYVVHRYYNGILFTNLPRWLQRPARWAFR